MAQDYTGNRDMEQVAQCQTAKDLLDKVTGELAEFEARKLNQLKAELDAFVKKQDGLVDDYKAKFPGLRKLWCDRQMDVERLCTHIKCEFPLKEDKWKQHVEKCICTPLHDLCCEEQSLAQRKRCCYGPLQRKKEEAQAAFDAAKARLDWLTALVAKLTASLTQNKDWVSNIEQLPATERAVALYLFWFKLVPSHKHLTPYDAPDECKKVCAEWDPNTLCGDIYKQGCKAEDGACVPAGEKPVEMCKQIADPGGAWLMDPDKYRNALDCAWQDYNNAKAALAKAEADFKQNPDDLDSLIKQLATDTAALDDSIKKCLKDVKPNDCCSETEPKKGY
jgi:hypothetical protein